MLPRVEAPESFPEHGELKRKMNTYCHPPREETHSAWGFCKSLAYHQGGWTCAEYLAGRNNDTHELWHPVKDRTCLLRDGPVGDNKFDQSREKG